MKILNYILIGIALAALAAIVYFVAASNEVQEESALQNEEGRGAWETKTNDEAEVSVTVTPRSLEVGEEQWEFDIELNTHTKDLSSDLMTAVTLHDPAGNTYAPLAWEGSGPGGHHRSGVLTFPAIAPLPSELELRVRGVGDVAERSFRWDLQ